MIAEEEQNRFSLKLINHNIFFKILTDLLFIFVYFLTNTKYRIIHKHYVFVFFITENAEKY